MPSHPWLRRSILITAVITGMAASAVDDSGPRLRPDRIPVIHRPRAEVVEDFAALVPPEALTADRTSPQVRLERVSTAVPWPRGLAWVDGKLVALARGRHRSNGGVTQDFDDFAGRLYEVDPAIAEPVIPGELSGAAVRQNGRVLARPAGPPMFPYDRSRPPEEDALMDRPYCGLDYDPVSRNLIVCCYAGAELADGRFRKHATDGLLRYDWRDARWHVLEQHNAARVPDAALGAVISNEHYPHHDPDANPPPHGWLNGPDGCAVAGRYLYAASKDNHLVVQYELDGIRAGADAPAPPSRPVLGPRIRLRLPAGCEREMEVLGACALAAGGGYLYVGYRTSSIVIRVPITPDGDIVHEAAAELIAVFEPWDPATKRSGDMFDIELDAQGRLYVAMSREGKVWRCTPDPAHPFFGNDQSTRPTTAPSFVDLAKLTGKPTGAGNILADDDGRLYVCTRNEDDGGDPYCGTIYRATIVER